MVRSNEEILSESSNKSIVLFSWIRPCCDCQMKISSVLSGYSSTRRRIVVLYTIPKPKKMKIPNIEGIETYQVDCFYRLSTPPGKLL